MNRQDKIQKLHNKRLKRARAKLKTSSKKPYISKADRAKTEPQNPLNVKLKNYTEFLDTVTHSQEEQRQVKIKAAADYIEYIKLHDKEAYKNYLSYSTYLNCV